MRLSISKIKTFKACRRAYQLKYVENLEPVKKPESLEMGSNYHKLVEDCNNGRVLAETQDDFTKEMAMARAYEKYIYPKIKVAEAEKWLEKTLGGDTFVGIADGIAEDGCVVEHKTTSMEVGPEYEYNLQWDEQILAYMWLTGARKVYYTVCRKPTIRLKKDETEENFFYRMLDWYAEDTDKKIGVFEITRTDEEVSRFEIELYEIVFHMKRAEQEQTSSYNLSIQALSPFYRNTCHCNSWGRRCEYASVCLHYDPNQQYIEFVRKDGEYEQQ